jgi:hypothetical protein
MTFATPYHNIWPPRHNRMKTRNQADSRAYSVRRRSTTDQTTVAIAATTSTQNTPTQMAA